MHAKVTFFCKENDNNIATPKKRSHITPLPPITVLSPRRPLSSVLYVAIVAKFDGKQLTWYVFFLYLVSFASSLLFIFWKP